VSSIVQSSGSTTPALGALPAGTMKRLAHHASTPHPPMTAAIGQGPPSCSRATSTLEIVAKL